MADKPISTKLSAVSAETSAAPRPGTGRRERTERPGTAPRREGNQNKEPREPRPQQRTYGVTRPDEDAFRKEEQAIREKIDACYQKLNDIKAQKEKLDGGRKDFNARKTEARAKLDALRNQIREKNKAKKELLDQMQVLDERRKSLRSKETEFRKKMEYNSIAEIETAVKRLEYRISTESLTIREERDIINQIKALNMSKGGLKELADFQNQTKEASESQKTFSERFGALKKEIGDLIEQEKAESAKFDELLTQDTSRTAREKLDKTREDASKQIDELKAAQTALRADWSNKMKEFQEKVTVARKKWEEDEKVRRAAESVRREEYRKQKDAERAAYEAEMAHVNPHEEDITMCENLIAHLERINRQHAAAATPAAPVLVQVETPAVLADAKGKELHVLKRDADAENELYKGLGAKGGKKAAKPEGSSAHKDSSITLSLQQVRAFADLKITAPRKVSEVAEAVKLLKEKRDVFKAFVPPTPKPKEEETAAASTTTPEENSTPVPVEEKPTEQEPAASS